MVVLFIFATNLFIQMLITYGLINRLNWIKTNGSTHKFRTNHMTYWFRKIVVCVNIFYQQFVSQKCTLNLVHIKSSQQLPFFIENSWKKITDAYHSSELHWTSVEIVDWWVTVNSDYTYRKIRWNTKLHQNFIQCFQLGIRRSFGMVR